MLNYNFQPIIKKKNCIAHLKSIFNYAKIITIIISRVLNVKIIYHIINLTTKLLYR